MQTDNKCKGGYDEAMYSSNDKYATMVDSQKSVFEYDEAMYLSNDRYATMIDEEIAKRGGIIVHIGNSLLTTNY